MKNTGSPAMMKEDTGIRFNVTEQLPDIEETAELYAPGLKPFIIADRRVAGLHGGIFPSGIPVFLIEAEERCKSLETAAAVAGFLNGHGAGRKSVLIGIGGGITTDLTGFCASIYKRGTEYISIPTTLLAMADASIGGKTGVNLDGYKNMLGTVKQPAVTLICTGFLRTLPEQELRSGMAEILKTGAIRDSDLFSRACSAKGIPDMETIRRTCTLKAGIVEADPFENGIRRILNFGHTYGHAIEKWHMDRNMDISHGEAVATGMCIAARISREAGFMDREETEKFISGIEKAGLPTCTCIPPEELNAIISSDKKADMGNIDFVFLRKTGSAEYINTPVKRIKELCLSSL